jgi:hypothetical protein
MSVFLGGYKRSGMYTRSELNKKSRLFLINWLENNDRNGVYNDRDSMREFGSIMSKSEAIDIILRQQKG